MNKLHIGIGVLLSLAVNTAVADISAVEPSIRQILTTAKEKQFTSGLKVPQATQGTGELLLRDAIYLYNLPVYAGYFQALMGFKCDIFQLVLDVENGHSDIIIGEGVLEDGYLFEYPDRIYDWQAMFAYALYTGYVDKSFWLYDAQTYGVPGIDPASTVGHATAFGYCYSTEPTAAVVYYDERNDRYYSSWEVNPF
jgi:hypothetical protein